MKPVSRSPPPPTAHRRERTLCSLLSTQHFHTPQLALILETKVRDKRPLLWDESAQD